MKEVLVINPFTGVIRKMYFNNTDDQLEQYYKQKYKRKNIIKINKVNGLVELLTHLIIYVDNNDFIDLLIKNEI